MILGLGQEIYKMSLEHLIVTENKGMLKKKINTHTHTQWGYVKGTQKPTKRAPTGQSWNNLSNKIK